MTAVMTEARELTLAESLAKCGNAQIRRDLLFFLNRYRQHEVQLMLEELLGAEPGTDLGDFHYRGVHYTSGHPISRPGYLGKEWRADGEPNKWK